MTDVVCAGCGSTQDGSVPYCGVCGRPFPRTQSNDVGTTVPESLSHTRAGGVGTVQVKPPAYAGTGRRFLAALVDGAVVGVVAWIVLMIGLAGAGGAGALLMSPDAIASAMTVPYLICGVLLLGYWLGVSAWEGKTGKTVGNLVCKVRTVDVVAHDPIGFGRAFVRWLIVGAGSIVCGIGQILVLVSPAFDGGGKRQGWHDKVGRAVVIMASDVPDGAAQPAAAAQAPAGAAKAPAGTAQAPAGTSQVWTGAADGARNQAQPPQTQQPTAQLGQPAAQGSDPWAFPDSSAGGAGPVGGPVITGIPGQAPGGSTGALPPQEEPATVRRPHPGTGGTPHPAPPAQPAQPAQQQPPTRPVQPPVRPTPAPAAPVQPPVQAPVQPPVQAPIQPPVQPDLTRRAPMPQPEAEHDSAPIDMTRTHMSRPMSPPAVTKVVLEVEGGDRYVVDTKALVGRNPQAPDGTGWILIKVEDPTRSVSKTHAELGVDTAGLWLTDRGSTNGTVVSAPGLPPRVAEPGARVRVPVGSTIHVGDRRVVVHPQAGA